MAKASPKASTKDSTKAAPKAASKTAPKTAPKATKKVGTVTAPKAAPPKPAASGVSLSTLKYKVGSRKRIKRIGRGQGSGHGGTSTRGHKGQGARAGAQLRPWFEGGQMPLIRRMPKFGFHSPFKVEYQVVNVSTLQELASKGRLGKETVTPEVLHAVGAVAKRSVPIKILGTGEITTKLTVNVHAFSASAKLKIEAAGGSAETLNAVKK